jgi:hypothetical protein
MKGTQRKKYRENKDNGRKTKKEKTMKGTQRMNDREVKDKKGRHEQMLYKEKTMKERQRKDT